MKWSKFTKSVVTQRNKVLEEARNKHENESCIDYTDLVNKIKLYDKILSSIPVPLYHKLIAPLMIIIISIMAIAILWTTKISRMKITLNVQSNNIHLSLTKPFVWSGNVSYIEMKKFNIENASHIKSLELRLESIFNRSYSNINIREGTVSLNEFKFIPYNISLKPEMETVDISEILSLEIQSNPGEPVFLFLHNGESQGKFFVYNKSKIQIWDRASKRITYKNIINQNPPPIVEFNTKSTSVITPYIQFYPKKSIYFYNIPIKNISFNKLEDQDTRGHYIISTIKNSSIFIHDTSQKKHIDPGTGIQIKGIKSGLIDFKIDNGIQVTCRGEVSDLLLYPSYNIKESAAEKDKGKSKFYISLKPNYLEYYYYHKKLGFLWTATIFIIGLLWSIRQFLLEK